MSWRWIGTTITGWDLEETRLHEQPALEEMRREIYRRVDEGERKKHGWMREQRWRVVEKPRCLPW
jgi:hypothetical protein